MCGVQEKILRVFFYRECAIKWMYTSFDYIVKLINLIYVQKVNTIDKSWNPYHI